MEKIEDLSLLSKFVRDFCNVLEIHCTYTLVSGFTSIASGMNRGTEDIDVVIERLSKEKYLLLHKDLSKQFEILETDDPLEAYERLKENGNIRYIEGSNITPNMEVKFARDHIDWENLKSRVQIPQSEEEFWFAPIESTIAFKETILKAEKDEEDAKHLRLVFKELLDEEKVKFYKKLILELRN